MKKIVKTFNKCHKNDKFKLLVRHKSEKYEFNVTKAKGVDMDKDDINYNQLNDGIECDIVVKDDNIKAEFNITAVGTSISLPLFKTIDFGENDIEKINNDPIKIDFINAGSTFDTIDITSDGCNINCKCGTKIFSDINSNTSITWKVNQLGYDETSGTFKNKYISSETKYIVDRIKIKRARKNVRIHQLENKLSDDTISVKINDTTVNLTSDNFITESGSEYLVLSVCLGDSIYTTFGRSGKASETINCKIKDTAFNSGTRLDEKGFLFNFNIFNDDFKFKENGELIDIVEEYEEENDVHNVFNIDKRGEVHNIDVIPTPSNVSFVNQDNTWVTWDDVNKKLVVSGLSYAETKVCIIGFEAAGCESYELWLVQPGNKLTVSTTGIEKSDSINLTSGALGTSYELTFYYGDDQYVINSNESQSPQFYINNAMSSYYHFGYSTSLAKYEIGFEENLSGTNISNSLTITDSTQSVTINYTVLTEQLTIETSYAHTQSGNGRLHFEIDSSGDVIQLTFKYGETIVSGNINRFVLSTPSAFHRLYYNSLSHMYDFEIDNNSGDVHTEIVRIRDTVTGQTIDIEYTQDSDNLTIVPSGYDEYWDIDDYGTLSFSLPADEEIIIPVILKKGNRVIEINSDSSYEIRNMSSYPGDVRFRLNSDENGYEFVFGENVSNLTNTGFIRIYDASQGTGDIVFTDVYIDQPSCKFIVEVDDPYRGIINSYDDRSIPLDGTPPPGNGLHNHLYIACDCDGARVELNFYHGEDVYVPDINDIIIFGEESNQVYIHIDEISNRWYLYFKQMPEYADENYYCEIWLTDKGYNVDNIVVLYCYQYWS